MQWSALLVAATLLAYADARYAGERSQGVQFIGLRGGQHVLRVAGPMQLTGKFKNIGLKAKYSLELWQEWAASAAEGYTVELALEDDGSDPAKAVDIAKKLAVDPDVHVIIAPYTSGASIKVVKAVAGRKPVLAWGGASGAIFETGNKNVFGFMSAASEYMNVGLDALKAEGAKDIILITNEKQFSGDVCNGARTHAEALGMTVQHAVDVKNDGSDVSDAMAEIKDAVTDVVVICGHLTDVQAMTKEMLDVAKYPHFKTNMVLSTQVSDPRYRGHIKEAGLSIDNCMMMPTQWASSERWKAKDPVVGWTSDAFVAAYKSKTGSLPSYHAAAAAASGVVLSNAIKAAGGIKDMDALTKAMRQIDVQTFYGPIKFSSSGALQGKPMLTVQNRPDNSAKVVAPESFREADVIYPMSACSAKSSGQGVADGVFTFLGVILAIVVAA